VLLPPLQFLFLFGLLEPVALRSLEAVICFEGHAPFPFRVCVPLYVGMQSDAPDGGNRLWQIGRPPVGAAAGKRARAV
jgi:hypothetical protein